MEFRRFFAGESLCLAEVVGAVAAATVDGKAKEERSRRRGRSRRGRSSLADILLAAVVDGGMVCGSRAVDMLGLILAPGLRRGRVVLENQFLPPPASHSSIPVHMQVMKE